VVRGGGGGSRLGEPEGQKGGRGNTFMLSSMGAGGVTLGLRSTGTH